MAMSAKEYSEKRLEYFSYAKNYKITGVISQLLELSKIYDHYECNFWELEVIEHHVLQGSSSGVHSNPI